MVAAAIVTRAGRFEGSHVSSSLQELLETAMLGNRKLGVAGIL